VTNRSQAKTAAQPAPHIWDGPQLAAAFRLAADWLQINRDRINALNVFPVPDGDTGTNMAMTMQAAVRAVSETPVSAGETARLLAYGALMGARGNSGVILSQIFRGFASSIQDRDEIDGRDLSRALSGAREMAYKAVMRPVEGTMLTVIRGAAERAATIAERTPSISTVLAEVITGAQFALDSTPQLLDILRQAGVVDAGGQGVVCILEGLSRYANGETSIEDTAQAATPTGAEMAFLDQVTELHGEDEFGYCTNFMVFGSGIEFDRVREEIAGMGQSAVIVGDDTMVKVHIHTENPGQVLDYALRLGALDQIKIDNMSKQTEILSGQRAAAVAEAPAGHDDTFDGDTAIVAVAAGDGLAAALRSMGATCIVSGGQTMNPSTQDLLDAVNGAPVNDVIVLPNNKNIILAANQLVGLTERNVRIVPTISVPQGLTALASFSPASDLDDNVESMTESLSAVRSLEITRAVRDVELNGFMIANGQLLGLIDDAIEASGDSVETVAAAIFAKADPESAELVTVFSGADATRAEFEAVRGAVESAFPDAEYQFQDGGQPHYLFVISVE
jgi:DAK2 domain fusion protein YloV